MDDSERPLEQSLSALLVLWIAESKACRLQADKAHVHTITECEWAAKASVYELIAKRLANTLDHSKP